MAGLQIAQGTRSFADNIIKAGKLRGFTADTLVGEVARNISPSSDGHDATDRDIMSMLVTASETGLSPVDGSLYGFKTNTGGLIKAISYTGWQNIVANHPNFSGLRWEMGKPERIGNSVHFDSITCWIKRKDCELEIGMPVYWEECAPPRRTEGSPWNVQPRHMHMVRAFTTSAKLAFGIKGSLYTYDEAIQAAGLTNVRSVNEEAIEIDGGDGVIVPDKPKRRRNKKGTLRALTAATRADLEGVLAREAENPITMPEPEEEAANADTQPIEYDPFDPEFFEEER